MAYFEKNKQLLVRMGLLDKEQARNLFPHSYAVTVEEIDRLLRTKEGDFEWEPFETKQRTKQPA